jgi:hypothetical protein
MIKSIQAIQGQLFQIKLQSSGGTGYEWCLTTMIKEVALVSVDRETTGIFGGPAYKIFNFIALEDTKKDPKDIGFKSICLYDPKKEAGEEVFFKVTIVPSDSNTLSDFVKYSENMATFEAVAPPYGYVDPQASIVKYGYGCSDAGVDPCGAPVKYGYPGGYKYGYPCDASGFDSCGAPVKYGYPGLKYGYPGCDTAYDPCTPVKYGFPGFRFGGYSEYDTGLDPCGSPIKYGYPGLKYGYPGCDVGLDPCGSPIKYGYPGLKYGYPVCNDNSCCGGQKYGYPPGFNPTLVAYGAPYCC